MNLSDRRLHRKPGSWKRVIWYLILLIVILILMWKMPELALRLPF